MREPPLALRDKLRDKHDAGGDDPPAHLGKPRRIANSACSIR